MQNAPKSLVTPDALGDLAKEAHGIVKQHPDAFRIAAEWFESMPSTPSGGVPHHDFEPDSVQLVNAFEHVTRRFAGRPTGERTWDLEVGEALTITFVIALMDPTFDRHTLDTPIHNWKSPQSKALFSGRRGAAILISSIAETHSRTWQDNPWDVLPIAIKLAAENAPTFALKYAYDAAEKFVSNLGTLAYVIRRDCVGTAIPNNWKDMAGSYGWAFSAWMQLSDSLTSAMRQAAAEVYESAPTTPPIKLGNLRPHISVIEAVAGELGCLFRNAVYLDRCHPLEPDQNAIAILAMERATARQVALGKPALPFGASRDVEEISREETRAVVWKRRGVASYGNVWLYMAEEWKKLPPSQVEYALFVLRCGTIDFDDLAVRLRREGLAVVAAAKKKSHTREAYPTDLLTVITQLAAAFPTLAAKQEAGLGREAQAVQTRNAQEPHGPLQELKTEKPGPRDREVWQMMQLPEMTQVKAAKKLQKMFPNENWTQPRVSEALKRAKKAAQQSGLAEVAARALPSSASKAPARTFDPSKAELGGREDSRAPHLRAKANQIAEDDESN